jgi:hypothetical protein
MTEIEKIIVEKAVRAKKSYDQSISQKNAHREFYLATRFGALFQLIIDLGLVNEYIDQL